MNLAQHMRISGLQVLDEDVTSRRQAANDLKTKWLKTTKIDVLFKRAGEIAIAIGSEEAPPQNLCAEVETAVQVHASAFLSSERPTDVGVCAAAAFAAMLEGGLKADGWTNVNVMATALWSALAFQAPLQDSKREALRAEILNAAHEHSMQAAEEARKRSEVADFAEFSVADDDAQTKAAFKKATDATIRALRRNAALDREEIDFLWWTLGSRSRVLKRPFSKIDEPVRLVAAGIEAASYLRRLPCDVHRELVLRHVDDDAKTDLIGLLASIGEDRAYLVGELVKDARIAANPIVFPLLLALVSGQAGTVGGAEQRSSSEWGARALLEASLLTNGPELL
jgi:GTPase-associated system helical domain